MRNSIGAWMVGLWESRGWEEWVNGQSNNIYLFHAVKLYSVMYLLLLL